MPKPLKYKDYTPVDEPVGNYTPKAGTAIVVAPEKQEKQSSRIKATLNYPNGPIPRAELVKDNVGYKPTFQAKDSSDEERARIFKEASEYASELQRESRGKKNGGAIKSASKRGDGIAQRGKTKGTIVMCGGGKAYK